MEGEVVAAGPGARGEDGHVHPLDVKAGDRILFGKWSGSEVKIDGEELMIMKESDILCIIEVAAPRVLRESLHEAHVASLTMLNSNAMGYGQERCRSTPLALSSTTSLGEP